MTEPRTCSGRGLIWALIGGAVIVAAIAAIVIASLTAEQPVAKSTTTTRPTNSTTSAAASGAYVDASVKRKGWVPEPITTDRDRYTRAALAAASTFDTQKSSRSDWLAFLDTWFTPDIRYTSESDRADDMKASQLELRQAVVLPESDWNSLANEKGRVVAAVPGKITYADVPGDSTGTMKVGTADVVLTYTRSDASGNESSYNETARVSVQVLCGAGSIPTPNSAQQPGDCKVVRFISGSQEP
ncbi:hypothetical protein [Microbacterium candidum]|uniref:Secreted protein n=1 Tax=Microbacterium candidum TaxID=3041922 RepID=A0ABT7MVZ6_9MICO|nr:hypothetical protein [Microbacterium sp. ASV49]MDL9978624.1 hypothetical protein [Microbacterium sp. ASV49]